MRRYKHGETVEAQGHITAMNRPEVPPGATGQVVATTLFGQPRVVLFAIQTMWGPKEFTVGVRRGDVR